MSENTPFNTPQQSGEAPTYAPYPSVPAEQRLVYESTPSAGPPAAEHSDWATPPMRRRRSRPSPWLFAGIGLAFGLVLGLVIGLFAIPAIGMGVAEKVEAAAPSPFEHAVEECELDFQPAYARIGDDGATLELQTEGDEAEGLSFATFSCAVEALDISDAVMSRIESTRALDGRQEASWGDFTASWTYHPDDGLTMLIERPSGDES